MPENQTRLLIVDDHAVFRDCLARGLEETGEFVVIATAGSVADALAALSRGGLDVVLLDYDLGVERGTELLGQIREQYPGLRVLVLTAWVEEAEIRHLVSLGVNGVILKKHNLATLSEAVRSVAASRTWFDEQCVPLLFAAPESIRESSFTDRERRTLRMVVNGLTNKQIALQLQISESSVKLSLQRLFDRMGVRSRGQLVREALEKYKGQY